MIDIDAVLFVEYDNDGKQPLVLIETARDVGQRVKPTTVLCALAKRADLPAWVVLYRPSESFNPADHNWPDIESFRVRRVWPHPIKEWTRVTPKEWAQWLVEIRRKAADKLDREEHW